MKYKTKVINIEAYQFKDTNTFVEDIVDNKAPHFIMLLWQQGKIYERKVIKSSNSDTFEFRTHMVIDVDNDCIPIRKGDYIIKSENGELYTCKACIFDKFYEKD